jgi:hypothetical protein
VIQKHFLAERRSLAQSENFKNLIFLASQIHPRAGNFDALLVQVNDEVADRDNRLCMASGATNDRVNSGDNLVPVEGFCQIIVGAKAQPL